MHLFNLMLSLLSKRSLQSGIFPLHAHTYITHSDTASWLSHYISPITFQGPLNHPLPKCSLVDLLADLCLDLVHGFSELLGDGLALQGVDVERVCLCGEDEEGYHGGLGVAGLQQVVEASQGLQEEVRTFVGELVPEGGKANK